MFPVIQRALYFLLAGFLFISYNPLQAQEAKETKSHDIGDLWETMFPTGSLPQYAPLQYQMCYPGADFYYQTKKNQEGIGVWIGIADWTDTLGTRQTPYVSEGGFENDEASNYTAAISNRKRVRYRLPNVTVNGNLEERFLDTRSSSTRSQTIPADERIETIWATNVGVRVEMFSYALANHNHNDYIIKEYTFVNDGNVNDNQANIELPDQNLTGVYFGFQISLIPGGDRGHQIHGQHDDWTVYYGNQPGDSLRGLFFKYDGRADPNFAPIDDIGDPDKTTGEFLSPQYPGWGILHADNAYNDETDNRGQPSTVEIKPRSLMRSYTKGNSPLDLYAEMSSGNQSRGTENSLAQHPYDPTVIEPVALICFGPYDIPFGQDVKIVLYEVVGSISQKLAIDAGRAWREGTLEFGGQTGNAAKNALLATGRDSILKNASHAEFAWRNGLANLPTPPPTPDDFVISSGPGKIDLQWKSVAAENDWYSKELDFAGYRIYRTEGNYTNVYSRIAEITGDTTQYTDRNVERGKKYYYAVTAFDDGTKNTTGLYPGQSLESSPYYNRNFIVGAVPFKGAYVHLDSIYVVPNPYHIQGLAFGGSVKYSYTSVPRIEDKLAFVGLPPYATIRVFTVHGDLVATIPHPNPENPNSIPESADEEWYQISDSWQTIKSGVYIYHIEGWDLNRNPLGSTSGKFVIIR